MDLSVVQRWTLLVALEDPTAPAQVERTLGRAWLPPYVLAASHGPYRPGVIRVELTVGGRDRWEVQSRVRKLVAELPGSGTATLLDITGVKGQVTRPRGGARGRRPNVEAGEVPAGPPRSGGGACRKCGYRPPSKGKWNHGYEGAGR